MWRHPQSDTQQRDTHWTVTHPEASFLISLPIYHTYVDFPQVTKYKSNILSLINY